MDSNNFPVFKTKTLGVTKKFDLNSPEGRKEYFEAKVGPEVKKLKHYVKGNSFVAFLMGKKNSGKGTYSKLFMEAIDTEAIGHLAVGDIVRDIHTAVETEQGKADLIKFLEKNYRGFHSIDETIDLILGRSQSTLVSSELILALIKYELSKRTKQSLFIDGFPRALDQVAYALYLKEVLGYRDDPDFFVFISVPNSIIDERIKYRVICPICKTPRSIKLLITKEIAYDAATKEFYLKCDTPSCNGERLVPKEGDELGIEPIRERLETDTQIFNQLLKLHGVPKVYLRNSVPVNLAADNVDDYELTPSYSFENEPDGKVKIIESKWTLKDETGTEVYSLLPPAIVVALIKQVADLLP